MINLHGVDFSNHKRNPQNINLDFQLRPPMVLILCNSNKTFFKNLFLFFSFLFWEFVFALFRILFNFFNAYIGSCLGCTVTKTKCTSWVPKVKNHIYFLQRGIDFTDNLQTVQDRPTVRYNFANQCFCWSHQLTLFQRIYIFLYVLNSTVPDGKTTLPMIH